MVHEEVVQLLAYIKVHKGQASRSYYVLFRFLAETGVRVAAALGFRVCDISEAPGTLPSVKVRWLKKRGGEAMQEIPVSPALIVLLKRLGKGRKPERRLWTQTDRATRYAMARYCAGAGLRAYSPKALRHYHLLTFYVAAGKDLRLTQDRAGHASPVTTTIYLHTGQEEVRKALQSMPELP
jgi:integrase/recombinase XerC